MMLFSEHGQLSNVTIFDNDHYNIRNSKHVLEWIRAVTEDVASSLPMISHFTGHNSYASIA